MEQPSLPIADKDHPAGFPAMQYDLAGWKQRAEDVRLQILVSLGLWPMPARPPVKAEVFGEIRREEFTISKVAFPSLPGHFVTGNLYRPTKGSAPYPAILSPHGHWRNGRLMWNDAGAESEVASGAEHDIASAVSPLQARCAMLASMGCVVFIYDMVGFGNSNALQHGIGFDDANAALHLQSFMGLQIWNGLRALDFLYDLPGIDRSRIGVTGASSGALQSVILAAIDDRIHATAAVAMIGLNMQGGCICENTPLLRVGTNNVEFAATIAPRPIGFASAQDWTHDFAERGLPELKHIYKLHSAAGNVDHVHVPFKHNCNVHSRELVYRFFNKHLRLNATEPLNERPFAPIPLAELSLSAWEAAHADLSNAAALRKQITERDRAAIAAIASTPEQVLATLRGALRVMTAAAPVHADELTIKGQPGANGVWAGEISTKHSPRKTHCALAKPTMSAVRGVIVWVMETADRATPAEALSASKEATRAVEAGFAVLAVGIANGLALAANSPLAFTLGYNRGVIGDRVHDIRLAMAFASTLARSGPIHLVSQAASAMPALLDVIRCDRPIGRVAIELPADGVFNVHDINDVDFLPGLMKYRPLLEAILRKPRDHMHFAANLTLSELFHSVCSTGEA